MYLMQNATEIATLKIATKRKKSHDGDDSTYVDVIKELYMIVETEFLKTEISR